MTFSKKYQNQEQLDIGIIFEEENLWIPIKIIIDTPLGGFVLKAKNIANNPLTKEEVR